MQFSARHVSSSRSVHHFSGAVGCQATSFFHPEYTRKGSEVELQFLDALTHLLDPTGDDAVHNTSTAFGTGQWR